MIELRKLDVMLASNHAPFSHPDWIWELKYDGHRALANSQKIVTRKHTDVTEHYPEVMVALRTIRGSFVIDGELCVCDDRGIPDFEAIQARSRRKRAEPAVTFFAFDLLFDQKGKDLRRLPVLERKAELQRLLPNDHARLRYVDFERGIGEGMFAYALSIGMEGVVGKRADSPYVAGVNRYWVKCKPAGFHDEGFKRKRRKT